MTPFEAARWHEPDERLLVIAFVPGLERVGEVATTETMAVCVQPNGVMLTVPVGTLSAMTRGFDWPAEADRDWIGLSPVVLR